MRRRMNGGIDHASVNQREIRSHRRMLHGPLLPAMPKHHGHGSTGQAVERIERVERGCRVVFVSIHRRMAIIHSSRPASSPQPETQPTKGPRSRGRSRGTGRFRLRFRSRLQLRSWNKSFGAVPFLLRPTHRGDWTDLRSRLGLGQRSPHN